MKNAYKHVVREACKLIETGQAKTYDELLKKMAGGKFKNKLAYFTIKRYLQLHSANLNKKYQILSKSRK